MMEELEPYTIYGMRVRVIKDSREYYGGYWTTESTRPPKKYNYYFKIKNWSIPVNADTLPEAKKEFRRILKTSPHFQKEVIVGSTSMRQKTFYNVENPKEALKERNAFAKKMEEKGYKIIKSSLGNQLLSFGGIGTEKPHREIWTKVYMVSYYKEL